MNSFLLLMVLSWYSSRPGEYSQKQAYKDLKEIFNYLIKLMPPVPDLPPIPTVRMGPYTVAIDCKSPKSNKTEEEALDKEENDEEPYTKITGVEYRPTEYRIALTSAVNDSKVKCAIKVKDDLGALIYDGVYQPRPSGSTIEIMTTKVGQPCLTTFRYVTLNWTDVRFVATPKHPSLNSIFEAIQTHFLDSEKYVAYQWNEALGGNSPLKDHMCKNLGKIASMKNWS